MKIINFLLLLSIISLDLFGQNTSYEKFKSNFPNRIIPNEIFVSLVEEEIPEQATIRGHSIVQEKESYTIYEISINYGMGGSSESTGLYVFNNEGKYISQLTTKSSFSDCSFSNESSLLLQKGNLWITVTTNEEYDCTEDTIIKKEVQIFEDELSIEGEFKTLRKRKVNLNREYAVVSYSILDRKVLEKYSKLELSTMRNEIFASYGYIFKSTKWKDYYSKQNWYKPQKKEVLETELSEVEKLNLSLIKELEFNN